MGNRIIHYECIAQDRIRNLYQQVHKNRFLGLPIQVSPNLPFIGQVTIGLGKPTDKEPALTTQLQSVIAYLEKHQHGDIGTIDEPKKYVAGTLPMFSHSLPQGFGVKETDPPEFIYYGGSTDAIILGLAGPIANLVGEAPAGSSMRPLSSAVPNLVRVLAKQYRIQTRFTDARYSEGLALNCIEYMEIYNRRGMQLHTFSFLATVKLDSRKILGRRLDEDKRTILASPLYIALVE